MQKKNNNKMRSFGAFTYLYPAKGAVNLANKELHCGKCRKLIEKKKDLVVTSRLLKFRTYHQDCFQKAITKGEYLGRPVSTPMATIILAIILLAALVIYIINRDIPVLLVLIISPIYRLLVWYRFERVLNE